MTYRVCYLRENGTVNLDRCGAPFGDVKQAILSAFNQRRAAVVDETNAVVWMKEGRQIKDLTK